MEVDDIISDHDLVSEEKAALQKGNELRRRVTEANKERRKSETAA